MTTHMKRANAADRSPLRTDTVAACQCSRLWPHFGLLHCPSCLPRQLSLASSYSPLAYSRSLRSPTGSTRGHLQSGVSSGEVGLSTSLSHFGSSQRVGPRLVLFSASSSACS